MGAAGERFIQREIGTSPDQLPALGGFVAVPWDTSVVIDAGSFTYADPTLTLADQRPYLVAYNMGVRSKAGSNGQRSAPYLLLKLEGAFSPYGRASGYFMRQSAALESYVACVTLIETTGASKTLEVHAAANDTNVDPTTTIERIPNTSALQVLALPTTWNYARLRHNGGMAQSSGLAWTSIDWTSTDRLDAAGFVLEGPPFFRLRCVHGGKYLFGYSVGAALAAGPYCNALVRLQVNGAEVPNSYGALSLNSNQGCTTGAIPGVVLLSLQPGDTVEVAYSHEGNNTIGWTPTGGNTISFWAIELLNYPDTARLTDTGNDQACPTSNADLLWRTEQELDVDSFTHSTGASQGDVILDTTDQMLMVAQGYVSGNSPNTRIMIPRIRWRSNAVDQNYGMASGYSPGTNATENANASVAACSFATILHAPTATQPQVLRQFNDGEVSGDTLRNWRGVNIGLQFYNLTRAFGAPLLKPDPAPMTFGTPGATVIRSYAGAAIAMAFSANLGVWSLFTTITVPTTTPLVFSVPSATVSFPAITITQSASVALLFTGNAGVVANRTYPGAQAQVTFSGGAGVAQLGGPIQSITYPKTLGFVGSPITATPVVVGGNPTSWLRFDNTNGFNPWDAFQAPPEPVIDVGDDLEASGITVASPPVSPGQFTAFSSPPGTWSPGNAWFEVRIDQATGRACVIALRDVPGQWITGQAWNDSQYGPGVIPMNSPFGRAWHLANKAYVVFPGTWSWTNPLVIRVRGNFKDWYFTNAGGATGIQFGGDNLQDTKPHRIAWNTNATATLSVGSVPINPEFVCMAGINRSGAGNIDVIPEVQLDERVKDFNNPTTFKSFHAKDVLFKWLGIENNGQQRAIGGSYGHQFGRARFYDCKLRYDRQHPTADFTGLKWGVRCQSFGCWDFRRVLTEAVNEHTRYIDGINAGHEDGDSYFIDETMTESTRTMYQFVNRRNEAIAAGVVGFAAARNKILLERSIATNIYNQGASAFTFVGHLGTIVLRDCQHVAGALNIADTRQGPGGTLYRTLLVWQDNIPLGDPGTGGSTDHGTFYDPDGFPTTRIVIDGLTVVSGTTKQDAGSFCQISGVGDVQVYKFDIQGTNGRALFELDIDGHYAIEDAGQFATNHIGPDGTERKAFNGTVRFMIPDSEMPGGGLGLKNYSGWNGAEGGGPWPNAIRIRRQHVNDTGMDILVGSQIDQYRSTAGTIPLPSGATFSTSTGVVSGTSAESVPKILNVGQLGYGGAGVWPPTEFYGVRGTNAANGKTALFELGIDGVLAPPIAPSAPLVFTPATGSVFSLIGGPAAVAMSFSVGSATVGLIANAYETGINIGITGISSTQILWRNVMKGSGRWRYTRIGGVGQVPSEVVVDSEGWPIIQDPNIAVDSTIWDGSMPGKYPSGHYNIRWTGSASVDFILTGAVGALIESGPGYKKRDVSSSGGQLGVRVTGTAGQKISGLDVWAPGFDPAENPPGGSSAVTLFNPTGARLLEVVTLGGPIRMLDIDAVNYCGAIAGDPPAGQNGWTPTGTWPHKKFSDPRWTEAPDHAKSGAPLEAQVALANEMGRDLWWNVPHLYSPSELAAAFDYINANLVGHVFLEYSNEAWNSGFPVRNYAINNAPTFGVSTDEFIGQQIFAMFTVAQNHIAASKLRKVVMGNRIDVGYIQTVLSKIPGTMEIHGVGCAAYLPLGNTSGYTSATLPETLIADARAQKLAALTSGMQAHRNVCDTRALAQSKPCLLLVYEAGQSFAIPSTGIPWLSAYLQSQVHQDMHLLYDDLRDMLRSPAIKANGVAWYSFCSQRDTPGFADANGAWGHLGNLYQLTGSGLAPKWDAIVGQFGRAQVATIAMSFTVNATTVQVGTGTYLGPTAFMTFTGNPGYPIFPIQSAPLLFGSGLPTLTVGNIIGVNAPATMAFTGNDGQYARVFTLVPPASRTYTPTEVASPDAHERLNLFYQQSVATPLGGRPVLFFSAQGLYLETDPIVQIDPAAGADQEILFNWIALGGAVISFGNTGVKPANPDKEKTFDGYDTSRWNDFTKKSPEKDWVYAIQWGIENATALGFDTRRFGIFATSSGIMTGLGAIVGAPRAFAGAVSSQALRIPKALFAICREPPADWRAYLNSYNFLGFGALHWLNESNQLATSLGDVAPGVLRKSAPSTYLREVGARTKQMAFFFAYDEPPSSTDFSRDGLGDPALRNFFDPQAAGFIHPYWNGIIVWRDTRGGSFDTKNELAVEIEDDLGVPNDDSTFNFADGMYGPTLTAKIVSWMTGMFGTRLADQTAPMVFSTPQAQYLPEIRPPVSGPVPVVFSVNVATLAFGTGNVFQNAPAQLTFTVPPYAGLTLGLPAGAAITFSVPNAQWTQAGNGLFLPIPVEMHFRAYNGILKGHPKIVSIIKISVGRVERMMVRGGF